VQTQSTLARSAYLHELFDEGPSLETFGHDVAPLGVEYVVLAKTVDWRFYGWLDHQHDLRRVLSHRTLTVFGNLAYRGVGRRTGAGAAVRRRSLVAYVVPPGSPGVATIDAAYQPGWVLDGHRGYRTPQGTVAFTLPTTAGGTARFTPWGLARLGDIVSGATDVVLAAALAVDRWRRRQRRQVSEAAPTA
jgi:hypothetical protein